MITSESDYLTLLALQDFLNQQKKKHKNNNYLALPDDFASRLDSLSNGVRTVFIERYGIKRHNSNAYDFHFDNHPHHPTTKRQFLDLSNSEINQFVDQNFSLSTEQENTNTQEIIAKDPPVPKQLLKQLLENYGAKRRHNFSYFTCQWGSAIIKKLHEFSSNSSMTLSYSKFTTLLNQYTDTKKDSSTLSGTRHTLTSLTHYFKQQQFLKDFAKYYQTLSPSTSQENPSIINTIESSNWLTALDPMATLNTCYKAIIELCQKPHDQTIYESIFKSANNRHDKIAYQALEKCLQTAGNPFDDTENACNISHVLSNDNPWLVIQ